jgi:hypothetical protein
MKGTDQQLLKRRQQLAHRLPSVEEIVRGSVLRRELRCGKPSCRCASGSGHPANYLTVSFAGGRTEQLSLPATVLTQAQAWVANYQAWWDAVEAISAINRELLRRRRASANERTPPPKPRRSRRPRS